jgi:formate dehydrogenase assembly factor FdhD
VTEEIDEYVKRMAEINPPDEAIQKFLESQENPKMETQVQTHRDNIVRVRLESQRNKFIRDHFVTLSHCGRCNSPVIDPKQTFRKRLKLVESPPRVPPSTFELLQARRDEKLAEKGGEN